MKLSTTNLIPLVFLLCFSQLVSALSIVAKEETPYIGNDLPGKGLSIEIINTAFERAGYKTNVVFESWPRAYEGGLIGVYDVIGSIWRTDEREKDFAFSEPYLFHDIKFIKRKADAEIKFDTLNDFDHLIIGTIKGYAYRDNFMNARNFIRLQQNYLIQNLLFLTQEKIDMTVGDVRKIRYEINKYMKTNMKDLEFLPKSLIKRGVHIAVSKLNPRNKEILAKFNKALKAMKSDGTYEKILKKHSDLSVFVK